MKSGVRSLHIVAVVALALSFLGQGAPRALAQTGFADPAFQRTWERTDKPVAAGKASRSWYWGPTPSFSLLEPYKEAPGGQRKVQYFDKTRMEINNPSAPISDTFYVTNGLLAIELMTGRMQVGNNDFQQSCAATIPLASDTDDASAPTYATFGGLMNAAKSNRVGQKATATVDGSGTVGDDPSKAGQPGVELVYYDATTNRNIPKVFWEFLNQQGVIYVNGQYVTASINQPWFFASGLPVTEAYWDKVKIGGQQLDVLIQAFERRVLTYIPAYNGSPFNVQMGNVGQHYYDWRYKGAGCAGGPPQPPPPPQPSQPPAPPPPTATPVASGPDCSGIPNPVDGTVTPNCGPVSTRFNIHIRGFTPNEKISFWLTDPTGHVVGTVRPLDIGSHPGELDDFWDGTDLLGFTSHPEGIWAITYEGADSHHDSIVWFKIVPTSGGPPPAPGACDTNGTVNGSITPTSGAKGTVFHITVTGFTAGEQIGYWLTDPDGVVYGTTNTRTAPGSSVTFTLDSGFLYPGRWGFTVQNPAGTHSAVVYFCITP